MRLLLSMHFRSLTLSICLKHILILWDSPLENIFSPSCVENRKILCSGRLLERLMANAWKSLYEIVIIVLINRLILINLVIEIDILHLAITSSTLMILALLVIVVLAQLILLNRPQVKLSLTFTFLINCGCSDGHLVMPLALLLLLIMSVG